MVEFETFVYLDVYRTGSEHLINLLKGITEERQVRLWRHASISRGGLGMLPIGSVGIVIGVPRSCDPLPSSGSLVPEVRPFRAGSLGSPCV